MAEVPLVDLEVILRYSLAIRQETADARDVLEALDKSRAHVLQLLRAEHGGPADATDGPTDEVEAVQDEAPTANGEVDAKSLPKPLPKEEAAARRAARRARRSKQ